MNIAFHFQSTDNFKVNTTALIAMCCTSFAEGVHDCTFSRPEPDSIHSQRWKNECCETGGHVVDTDAISGFSSLISVLKSHRTNGGWGIAASIFYWANIIIWNWTSYWPAGTEKRSLYFLPSKWKSPMHDVDWYWRCDWETPEIFCILTIVNTLT